MTAVMGKSEVFSIAKGNLERCSALQNDRVIIQTADGEIHLVQFMQQPRGVRTRLRDWPSIELAWLLASWSAIPTPMLLWVA